MKVLVTGANGFVGRALVPHLSDRGVVPVPVVRRPSGTPHESVLDISDAVGWRAAMLGCDSVVHLAGKAHAMQQSTKVSLSAVWAANVDNTLAVARYAVDSGVPRFVFLSSVKVHSESTQPGQCLHEEDAPAPRDDYARSKLEAEQALFDLSAQTGLEIVVIRSPLVYGPGVKGNFGQLIKWGTGRIPLPLGAVNNARSVVALENLLDFVCLCANRDLSVKAINQVFLVADGEPVSTTQLLHKLAIAYGVGPWLVPVPAEWLRLLARYAGVADRVDKLLGSLVVSTQKARTLLGWKPPIDMHDQMCRMRASTAK